jgi:hypothetical protein
MDSEPAQATTHGASHTVRYIADDKLALSITKEKAADQVDLARFERFARKAQVPAKLVLGTARETANKMRTLWPVLLKKLPLDRETRFRVTAHMKSIPLLKEYEKICFGCRTTEWICSACFPPHSHTVQASDVPCALVVAKPCRGMCPAAGLHTN